MAKRYQEIVDYIKEKIDSTAWPVGYKLPREVDLCTEFDVSRTTIRRALSLLVANGHLQRVKGTGTFVTQPKIIENTSIFIESFAEELRERGLSVVTEVLEFRPIAAEGSVATHLQVAPGEQVVKLCRLRYAGGNFDKGPIVLTTSYFPNDVGKIMMRYDMEKNSVRHLCQMNGIIRARTQKRLTAVQLPARERRLLGAQDNDLFISITSEIRDINARCVEYVESYYPVDRNEFTISTLSH